MQVLYMIYNIQKRMMKKYTDNNVEKFYFHIVDYCVFAAMLILSAVTGVYFGYYRKKNFKENIQQVEVPKKTKQKQDFGSESLNEYLLGSRKLKVFPVAMSLVASYISGVTVLGTPAEIYNFGTQYWMIIIPIVFMGLAVSRVYLPVFSTLGLGSSYQYLEMRFSSAVRSIASVMFVIDEVFFLPMIVYVPSLAFNQVTGTSIYIIGAIVCVICVFYTLVGGIKAVVVTDAWQVAVMFISVVVVCILGLIAIGGPVEVINRANDGGRLIFFNVSPSFYERHSFWSVLIGGFFYWTSYNSVHQTMVQRYMSLPNIKKAQWSICWFTIGIILFVSICCFAGLLIYAAYWKCDPLTAGLIRNNDQLFPVYVMQTVGNLRGVPGLFIAGVFGAALSSLSVVLNSTSAVILEDIAKGCFKLKLSDRASTILVKSSVLVLGVVSFSLMFLVERLGGILSLATSLSAIAAGTTFGMFTLGMLIPWSNTKGVIAGAICGAIMSGWVSFGIQVAEANGLVVPHKLPVSIEGCMNNSSLILSEINYPDESNVFPLYRFSFDWISPIGIFTTVIVGTIVSFLTGPTDLKTIDPDLISPVIHRFLPKECFLTSTEESSNLPMTTHREATVASLTTYLLPEINGSTNGVVTTVKMETKTET
ncbi:sodium-coupled monocarboxylate transporter 1-like isoform X2 [Condylostylus longicornis]|uniref:sodium-coupled monocarboxylate transporter 1-like isoform X2 n=1 Tax=Condylostylus longicornis TaxID=2530218 RepID=UPI00244DC078|nr:sodium-coupled monocarboxylate transporter 1-like isoform X2 [Condylostylus longicornis]